MTQAALETARSLDDQLSDAQAALNEIDETARMAFQNMEAEKAEAIARGEQPGESKGKANPIDPASLSSTQKNDRIKVQARRAQNQREKGRAELTKIYSGAMTVEHNLQFYDLNIASSCERFLGICDQAPYVIGRRGPSVLGVVATSKVLEQIGEMVDKYYTAGKEAQLAAETLFKVEREKVMSDDEWITPRYQQPAMALVTQAKHRGTSRLIAGMRAWDEAVRIANVLSWNGAIKDAEIANIRSSERKAFTQVFSLCNRAVVGLYRGTLIAEPKKRDKTAEDADADAPGVPATAASQENSKTAAV